MSRPAITTGPSAAIRRCCATRERLTPGTRATNETPRSTSGVREAVREVGAVGGQAVYAFGITQPEVETSGESGEGVGVVQIDARVQRHAGDGPVHRAGVQETQAEPARHESAHGGLAGRHRAVYCYGQRSAHVSWSPFWSGPTVLDYRVG